ncbi:MAG: hypothetical protein OXR66_06925 [Candidatus Woesearchaeota archaeon]|nr:hypothetical protein [Candidatus Woesearchaeota archaeon]
MKQVYVAVMLLSLGLLITGCAAEQPPVVDVDDPVAEPVEQVAEPPADNEDVAGTGNAGRGSMKEGG